MDAESDPSRALPDTSEARQQAEQVLRENEKGFGALFELAAAGVAQMETATGRFTRINQRYCDIVGYTRDEMLALDFQSLTHPDDLQRSLDSMRRLVAGEVREYAIEKRYLRKDGRVVWVNLSVSPLWAPGAPPDYHMAVVEDVTERKRAEEALRQSRALLLSVTEGTSDAIFVKDAQGRYLMLNSATARLLGKSNEEILGKDDTALLSLEDARRIMEDDRRVIESGAARTYEEKVVTVGVSRVFLSTKGPVRDTQGEVIGVFGIVRDITDRKQAEAALLESEARLRGILDSTPFPIAVVDLQDNNIKFWSTSALTLFGHAAPTAPEWYQIAYPDPDYRREVIERWKPFLEIARQSKRAVNTGEYRVTCSDGSVRICELYAAFLSDDLIVTFNDITERKRAEAEREKLQQQLVQSQKMEAVGRLAGGVAHDFNNMLSVILGQAEMALEQVEPGQPLYQCLQEIQEAGKRSADLTLQLLAFARRQTVTPKVLDLNETVEGILRMMHRLIGEDIELAWLPGTGLWPIKMDSAQIDQILANLCVNARDAIAGVGKVTIETGNTTFDEAYCAEHPGFAPGEHVLLAVSDSGCGMDKEVLPHIFEPFFTTKQMGKGTGLGLATIYGIVKQNDGFINLYSEPGRGTTFRIYLPRHVGEAAQIQDTGPAEPASHGHETILLVEDEPAILRLGKKILESLGYEVLAASTPSEAIRLAEEHSREIDLLMTDVVMPEMNGRDLAMRLLSLYPKLKRLFMSGYTANVIAHHGVLDEGVHFVQKPFSRQDLAAKVREALE